MNLKLNTKGKLSESSNEGKDKNNFWNTLKWFYFDANKMIVTIKKILEIESSTSFQLFFCFYFKIKLTLTINKHFLASPLDFYPPPSSTIVKNVFLGVFLF